jgi:CheY-like chemotaxis protein
MATNGFLTNAKVSKPKLSHASKQIQKRISKYGPIVLIEDDEDDIKIFTEIVRELKIENEIKWFSDTNKAFTYLLSTEEKIFMIFCDINLPGKNGLDFKRDIDASPELRKKSIPFIFYSTVARVSDVNEAYTKMTVQGFFKKENSHAEIKATLQKIFDYWMLCKHPND